MRRIELRECRDKAPSFTLPRLGGGKRWGF